MTYPVLAITSGDPGGIGPEVTVKALLNLKRQPLYRTASFLLIGPLKLYQYWVRRTRKQLPLIEITNPDQQKFSRGRVYVLNTGKDTWTPGKVTTKNAETALASLKRATDIILAGYAQALVTAPIHKLAMRRVQTSFRGHTEYLARACKVKKYAMLFDSPKLRVTLVTIHLPLKKVPRAIKKNKIQDKIQLTHHFLRQQCHISRPRIAVAALNPHGREFGTEEERIIAPAVKAMRRKGIRVTGPLPGDEIFFHALQGRFDAVVAMYHDQGLAALKAVAFQEAVNITLGLPFIRTSPDHGTAFDIAFKNKANEGSMLASIRRAIQLTP